MKIGIVSDTHGCLQTWEKIFSTYLQTTEMIIHAGDILYHGPRNTIPAEYNPKQLAEVLNNCPVPIVSACGNCDAEIDGMILNFPIQSPYTFLVLDKLRILVTHGHRQTQTELLAIAQRMQVKLVITGHTHVAVLEQHDDIFWLNPGSPGMSKRTDKRGTIALLTEEQLQIVAIDNSEILQEAICRII